MNPMENEFQIVAEIKSATDLDALKEIALKLYFMNCHMRQFFKDTIARHPADFSPNAYQELTGESHDA